MELKFELDQAELERVLSESIAETINSTISSQWMRQKLYSVIGKDMIERVVLDGLTQAFDSIDMESLVQSLSATLRNVILVGVRRIFIRDLARHMLEAQGIKDYSNDYRPAFLKLVRRLEANINASDCEGF